MLNWSQSKRVITMFIMLVLIIVSVFIVANKCCADNKVCGNGATPYDFAITNAVSTEYTLFGTINEKVTGVMTVSFPCVSIVLDVNPKQIIDLRVFMNGGEHRFVSGYGISQELCFIGPCYLQSQASLIGTLDELNIVIPRTDGTFQILTITIRQGEQHED